MNTKQEENKKRLRDIKNKSALVCCISCNVSLREEIKPNDLISIFKNAPSQNELLQNPDKYEYIKQLDKKWIAHLYIFFNEILYDFYKKFMIENNITIQDMENVYWRNDGYSKNNHFLNFIKEYKNEYR